MAGAAGPFEPIGGNKVVFYPEMSAVQYLRPITFGFAIAGNDLTMTSDPAGGPDVYFRSTYVRAE
jgi:hypothetical protein